MRITADVDVRDAIAEIRRVRGEFPDKAIAQALNRTANTVRATAARTISKEMGPPFKTNLVRKFIHVEKANKSRLEVVIRGKGKSLLSLAYYNVRQTPTGVTARVGGRSVSIPHAFIPKAGSSFVGPISRGRSFFNQQVYMRAPAWGKKLYTEVTYRPKGARSPYQRLMVPGVPAVFQQRAVNAALLAVVNRRFPIELDAAAVNALRRLQ